MDKKKKVRRGGTDTDGKWLGKKGKAGAVFDPLTPQFEPYILELDEAKPYVWCQCGVSTKQVCGCERETKQVCG